MVFGYVLFSIPLDKLDMDTKMKIASILGGFACDITKDEAHGMVFMITDEEDEP